MAHQKFSARKRNDPISFDFEDETFHCVDEMDWPTLERIMEAKVAGNLEGVIVQIGPFFRNAIVDEDLPAFEKVLQRKQARLDAATLKDIMIWLVEQYAARPTQRPIDSSDGPPKTGANLKVISLEQGTVREGSAEELEKVLAARQARQNAEAEPEPIEMGI